jgi:ABC-2 type transport system ATP-binding protein
VVSKQRVAGDVDQLLAAHRRLTRPTPPDAASHGVSATNHDDALARESGVVAVTDSGWQTILIVRQEAALSWVGWEVQVITLEELVLAYLANPSQSLILPLVDTGQESKSAAHHENQEEHLP